MTDYAAIERRNKSLEQALYAPISELEQQEKAERYAPLVRIERSDRFTITFPNIDFRNLDTKRLMAEVKALPERRFDPITKQWLVPLASAEYVEIVCESYGLTIERAADAVERIAELERQLAERDEYISGLEQELALREAVAA